MAPNLRLLFSVALVLTTAGCTQRLTGTRLDLLGLPLPILPFGQQGSAGFAAVIAPFLDKCDRETREAAPSSPFRVKHLYVFDSTPNVVGMWGFTMFADYKGGIDSYKIKDVSIIKDIADVRPGPGNYVLKRTVLEQKTMGEFTYRGGRQEFIDTVSGEVKAERTNYYLGSDFARGVSCLDSNWASGFDSFVKRSISFNPGYPREDTWVNEIPHRFVHAELRSQKVASESDFKLPIYPEGAVYNYNDRKIVIEGVGHYLRQTFNNEPLRMVGVQAFSDRMLISYETNRMAPSVLFQIRNKSTGQLLQEIYVKIPLSLHQSDNKIIHLHPWRIAKEGVTFEGGKIRFDIVQIEEERRSRTGNYFRYSIEAPWETEDVRRNDLPPYLDDGSYQSFTLPKSQVGNKVTAEQVVGTWISEPTGAKWEFNSDNTLIASRWSKWDWAIKDGALTVSMGSVNVNKGEMVFRVSKDGKLLEVTKSNVAGTYRPFLLHREQ